MFKHSVKVPRLYKIAAKVAKDVREGVGSIKQLVYENRSKHPNIKAIYALVATLFQRDDEIENLLKRSQLLVKEPRSDPWLTKILIVELLWGKKSLPGNSKPENTVLAYEQIFKAHISDIPAISKKIDQDSKEDTKPRYVRVNTLYMSLNEAVDGFRDEGWVLSKFLDKTDYKGFLDKITSLGDEEFLVDIHIPNLLIFPPKTQFYNHPAYKNGSIVLQDKASCLPVHILDPPPGSVVLDMCAAPGMKTTQVAAAMNNEGKVYAVERDPRRFETLNRIVEASGATCITTVNKDVLTCIEKDFPGVQYILVDPSCSGSGITDRLGFEQTKSNERIEKLAGFQIKILRSALTRYSNAKRVVYSTCSIFPEENEDVVRQVLETNSAYKLVPATKFVNNTWKNFGSTEYGDIGSYCLYAKPNEDFTNGFFVAVFEKLEEGEENQFFNTKIYNFKKHVQSQQNRKRRQQQVMKNDDTFGNHIKNKKSESQFQTYYNTEGNIHDEIKEEISDVVESSSSVKKKKKKNVTNVNENIDNNSLEPQICQNKIAKERKSSISDKHVEISKNIDSQFGINNKYTEQIVHDKIKEECSEVVNNSISVKKNKKKKVSKVDENINNEPQTSDNKKAKKIKSSHPDTQFEINIKEESNKECVKEEFSESCKSKKKRKKDKKNISEDFSENVESSDIYSVPKIELDNKKKKEKMIDSEKAVETVDCKKKKFVRDDEDHIKVKRVKKKKEKSKE